MFREDVKDVDRWFINTIRDDVDLLSSFRLMISYILLRILSTTLSG